MGLWGHLCIIPLLPPSTTVVCSCLALPHLLIKTKMFCTRKYYNPHYDHSFLLVVLPHFSLEYNCPTLYMRINECHISFCSSPPRPQGLTARGIMKTPLLSLITDELKLCRQTFIFIRLSGAFFISWSGVCEGERQQTGTQRERTWLEYPSPQAPRRLLFFALQWQQSSFYLVSWPHFQLFPPRLLL